MRPTLLRILRSGPSRRFASSTPTPPKIPSVNINKEKAAEAAAKAQDAAKAYAGKAVELLGKSGGILSSVAAKMGGRTARAAKIVEGAIPPTIYYAKVTAELAKIIFRAEKMTPPDLSTFRTTFRPFLSVSYITSTTQNLIKSARAMTQKDAAYAGVITAQILGFFTVGEMLGRRKIVGYRGKVDTHH